MHGHFFSDAPIKFECHNTKITPHIRQISEKYRTNRPMIHKKSHPLAKSIHYFPRYTTVTIGTKCWRSEHWLRTGYDTRHILVRDDRRHPHLQSSSAAVADSEVTLWLNRRAVSIRLQLFLNHAVREQTPEPLVYLYWVEVPCIVRKIIIRPVFLLWIIYKPFLRIILPGTRSNSQIWVILILYLLVSWDFVHYISLQPALRLIHSLIWNTLSK
jgi:hypothetical protein